MKNAIPIAIRKRVYFVVNIDILHLDFIEA